MMKINDYERNGLLLGKNLIITTETANNPLDVKEIVRKIEEFLI